MYSQTSATQRLQHHYVKLIRTCIFLALACVLPLSVNAAEKSGSYTSFIGRWRVASLYEGILPKEGQIYDFIPCGKELCGIEVINGKCGRIAFHLSLRKDGSKGRFVALKGTPPFIILSGFPSAKQSLKFVGHFGWRDASSRTYPLEFLVERQGDAVCNTPTS
jgi:hypothetical protein